MPSMRRQLAIQIPHPPEQVLAALTDFSERRPDRWPMLDRRSYRVHSVGKTEAEITEGTTSPVGRFWARERYVWSSPGVVTWTVVDSNFCRAGTRIVARVEPGEGGGTRLDLDWERKPKGWRGAVFAASAVPLIRTFLRRSFQGVRL